MTHNSTDDESILIQVIDQYHDFTRTIEVWVIMQAKLHMSLHYNPTLWENFTIRKLMIAFIDIITLESGSTPMVLATTKGITP